MFNKKSNKSNSKSLDSLFYPNSIAVIGASNDINKIGGYIFNQILTKTSNIHAIPINPKNPQIQNQKAYQNIIDIPKEQTPELIIIAIPKQFILQTLNQIVKTTCKNIIIITAGFKETGDVGKVEENKIKEIVKQNNLNLIGPNCLGMLNPEINLNCSFAKDIPKSGNTALISQSGAVIDAIIDWSFEKNIGFSKIVSLGNMAGVDELEVLEYLKKDKQTKSIVFYMETLEKGNLFAKTLKEISKTKPIIIIKPGNSQNAKKAIGSHTGSLAQDNILVQTLIYENNGILVENLNELFNCVTITQNIDKITNNPNTVILTNAGGPGVIATDEISEKNSKLKLYQLSDKQKEKIQKNIPKEAGMNNPIDIIGDAKSDRYTNTLNELIKIKDLQNILILLTPQIMTDCENIAKDIIKINKKTNKNIITAFLGNKQIKNAKILLEANNIPNFQVPNDAIQALNKIINYKIKNSKKKIKNSKPNFDQKKIDFLNSQIENKKGLLDQKITSKILKSLNITPFEKQIICNEHEIFQLKINSNQKYVLKIDSPELIHKKEFGAIKLNINKINYKEEILKSIKLLKKQKISNYSITLEKQISGYETIVGLKQDENLGNFIIFGMGGTYVSIFKDINISQAPLNKNSAQKIIEQSKIFPMLNGYRGSKPININKLNELLIKISYLQIKYPTIKEVDFNPVICNENDCYLVDVKLIL